MSFPLFFRPLLVKPCACEKARQTAAEKTTGVPPLKRKLTYNGGGRRPYAHRSSGRGAVRESAASASPLTRADGRMLRHRTRSHSVIYTGEGPNCIKT
jgi:hypothetical protein